MAGVGLTGLITTEAGAILLALYCQLLSQSDSTLNPEPKP